MNFSTFRWNAKAVLGEAITRRPAISCAHKNKYTVYKFRSDTWNLPMIGRARVNQTRQGKCASGAGKAWVTGCLKKSD